MNKQRLIDRKRLLELAGMEDPDFAGMDAPPEDAGMEDTVDSVAMDVPLFIRLLEWSREDSQNDMQLHKVAENLVALSQEAGGSLSMDDYEAAIAGTEDMAGEEKSAMPMRDDGQAGM